MALTLIIPIIATGLSTSFVFAEEKDATIISNQGILRNLANFQGEVIETLPIGTQVMVKETTQDWYQVQLQGGNTSGWIYKDILIKNEETTNTFKKGTITANILNVRSIPSTDGSIVTKLSNGSDVTILDTKDQWYQIQLANGTKGFVHSDFVTSIPSYPKAKVLKDYSSLREKPNSNSPLVMGLNTADVIYIKGYDNGWYHVVTKDFIEGFIKSEVVTLHIDMTNPVSRSGSRTATLTGIKSVTEKYLGKPYQYGASGPNAFDCSGFTSYILSTYYKDYLRQKQINLPRSSRDQANVGTRINRNQLQTGDLVFFNNGTSRIQHVGIYIGDNQFIHSASGRNSGIIISSLSESYYDRGYHTATRL
ncbi:C40 family peptidase [Alkaliphilus metalliredigens]|nr:SH3 domain-containing protein [Alkaliphilus metalliredigens]